MALSLVLLVGCGSSGCGGAASVEPVTPAPLAETPTEATSESVAASMPSSPDDVLAALVQALRENDAAALGSLVDPVHGAVFWGTPGCCLAPVLDNVREDLDFASALFDAQDFDGQVVAAYDAGFPTIVDDADDYQVPPETEIESAPAFASRDRGATRFLRLVEYTAADLPALAPRIAELRSADTIEYRFASGYTLVRVVLIAREGRHYLAHVATWNAYDA